MANLFDKAKVNGVKKAIEKHEVVNVEGLEKDLKRMIELDAKIKALQAEHVILHSGIREKGVKVFIETYNNKKSFPGTLKITSGNMNFQFIPKDAYLKIDEDRSKELIKKYGKEVIAETSNFTFNNILVQKYSDVLSDLIVNCEKISDVDKENLVESETKFSVAKGMIKNLKNEVFAKFKLNKLIEDIQPICDIKSIKINE